MKNQRRPSGRRFLFDRITLNVWRERMAVDRRSNG